MATLRHQPYTYIWHGAVGPPDPYSQFMISYQGILWSMDRRCLTDRSGYFRTIFEYSFLEANKHCVAIETFPECEYWMFAKTIHYICTGLVTFDNAVNPEMDNCLSKLIEICIIADYFQVPGLIQSVADKIKQNCNNMITKLAGVRVVRPTPLTFSNSHANQLHTFEWSSAQFPDVVRTRFTAGLRSLYNHPTGAQRLPAIKSVMFRFLNIAGPRFITTAQVMELARQKDMPGFMADIAEVSMWTDLAVRLQQPESATYRIMSSELHTKRLMKSKWTCVRRGRGCLKFVFANSTDTCTVNLTEFPVQAEVGTGSLRPTTYCQVCIDAWNSPQWIQDHGDEALTMSAGHPGVVVNGVPLETIASLLSNRIPHSG